MATAMEVENTAMELDILEDDVEDEIVEELDVYVCNGIFPPSVHPYLLQFTAYNKNRTYDAPIEVHLKEQVKRLQMTIKINETSNYYNPDVSGPQRIKSHMLLSSRVDPGIHGLSMGFRHENGFYILPIEEVLQMRHNPTYQDKDKDLSKHADPPTSSGGALANNRSASAASATDTKEPSMLPITVQVKKHETEQQTEARLRSYAYHTQREEQDPWIDLHYVAGSAIGRASLLNELVSNAMDASSPEKLYAPLTYLDAFVPGPSISSHVHHARGSGAYNNRPGSSGMQGGDFGRPHSVLGESMPDYGRAEGPLSPDAMEALSKVLPTFFAQSPVLSLVNIRSLLSKLPTSIILNQVAQRSSDRDLHAAIVSTEQFIVIGKSYIARTTGNTAVDPLRSLVIRLLHQNNNRIKKSDVKSATEAEGMVHNENMYTRVMKDLCNCVGGTWSIKPGS